MLTRRELVERMARAALVPGGVAFFERWAQADPMADYQPMFFDTADYAALQAFTEILIPTDESPGAKEARCAQYIDFVLHASDDVPKVQTDWRDAMKVLQGIGFHDAAADRKLEIVSAMARYEMNPELVNPAPVGYNAYRLIKQQTAFSFYTSKQGLIDTLDYRGNTYNVNFPGCDHPEHKVI